MAETLIIPDIGSGLLDDVVAEEDGLIERGGPGSGFHGHAGRIGEVGGSAPEGTPRRTTPPGKKKAGRSPLPAGEAGREAEWKKDLRKPPSVENFPKIQQLSKWGEAIEGINKTLIFDDPKIESFMQYLIEKERGNIDASMFNNEENNYKPHDAPDDEQRDRIDSLYEMFWWTKFNIETYGLEDQLSDDELNMLDEIGAALNESGFVPGKSIAPDDESPKDWEEDWDVPKEGPFGEEVWPNYESSLPENILNNPEALVQAQIIINNFTRRRNPYDELKPFMPGRENTLGYFSVFEMFQPTLRNVGRLTHPAIIAAIGDAWTERAQEEGTPEYYEAVKLGGVDPEKRAFWIDGIHAMLSEPQWTPQVEPPDFRDLADSINVGWVNRTNLPPSILAMNAAARLFGPVFGTEEADPFYLNDYIGVPSKHQEVPLHRDQDAVNMSGTDMLEWINDPDRQAQAEEIIDGMYQRTQNFYRDRGFDPEQKVVLYRGLRTLANTDWNPTGEESNEVNDAELQMWPISSWSLNEDEARAFSSHNGAIVRAEVPISRILCNAQTGFPCQHEQEVVVIGGKGLTGTVYSVKDDDDVIRQGGSPKISGDYINGEPSGPVFQAWLNEIAQDIPALTTRGLAVSIGGGFSLPSEMMTPELMKMSTSPKRPIYVDEAGGADWLTDGLAAEGLDRFKVDGIGELEEDDLIVEKYTRKRRAESAKKTKKTKKPAELTQRHMGPGDHPSGSPQEVHAGGRGGVKAGVATKPAATSDFQFSRELPNSDRILEWLGERHVPLDLLEKQAKGTEYRKLSQEEKDRWNATSPEEFQQALDDLEGVDLRTINKEEFVRPADIHDIMDEINALQDKAEEEGDEEAVTYYREIWMALYGAGRTREEVFDFAVRKAISNGELSVEDGHSIDSYDFGRFEGSREWQPLPETLYHTTVAGSAIRETGLKSRWELQGEGMGLGGGNDSTISYTDDPEWARDIERTIQEVQQVSSGEVSATDLIRNAAQGIGNNGKPFLTNLMSFSGMMGGSAFKGDEAVPERLAQYLNSPDFDPAVPIPERLATRGAIERAQEYIDMYVNPDTIREELARKELRNRYEWLSMSDEAKAEALAKVTPQMMEDRQRELAFDLYKGPYLYSREHAGGHRNPLIWGGSWQDFAEIDPNEIVTFQFKPKPGAMGGQFSALGEWRSYGSENVDMVDELNQFDPEDLWTEKSLLDRAFGWLVRRGGKGSGYTKEKGHKGRVGEVGGSVPADDPGGYVSDKPGMETYGSGVFTPMLKEVIYNWQGQPGWGTAQMIFHNVVRAREANDEAYQGLAVGQDGLLQGIGALDYDAPLPEGISEGEYLKIDGLYTPDPAFSEELMIQIAIEAAKHGKGLWMNLGPESGPLASQMGMDVVDDVYAYWTAEEVSQIAESLTSLEPKDYFAPPTKPRLRVSFNDAFEETMPENPADNRAAPAPISEMPTEERYRWENFNYSAWAEPESWNPQAYAKEQLGYDPEGEEFISSVYDTRVIEDIQNVHDGWVDGTDSPWSVRFSEAVANVFGGQPIPPTRPRDQYESAQEFLEVLSSDYGSDVIIPDDVNWYDLEEDEKWQILDEFHDFSVGARDEDIATDLSSVAEDIYEKTQAKFKEAGYSEGDTVRLYRGIQSTPDEYLQGHDGGWMRVQPWAISSWTAAKSIAGDFATMEGERSDVEGSGTLLTADIPVERILSMWQTGPGSHGEFEYLVLGQDGLEAYATRVDAKRLLRHVKEGLAAEAGKEGIGIGFGSEEEGYDLGPELE